MKWIRRHNFVVITVLLPVLVNGWTPTRPTQAFDVFGDINCEDEWARLDNFAIQLQQQPLAKGYIIFYGGRIFRGRLPKRGEAAARAIRLKPYLVEARGIPSKRVVVINGGYDESWNAELWIVPPGASEPVPFSRVLRSDIKFGKGRVTARQFRCLNSG
jgi:hypothetical protein